MKLLSKLKSLFKKPAAAEPVPGDYYRSCSDLPLAVFIAILLGANINRLTLSGKPSTEELTAAWADIHSEYIDLIANSETRQFINLTKRINISISKLNRLETIVAVMQGIYHPKLAEELRRMGYDFPFNPEDKKQYTTDLAACISLSKTEWVELQGMQKEYEELTKKTHTQAYSRKYFDAVLVSLSKFMRYEVDESRVTVSKYCAIYQAYEKFSEQVNLKNNANHAK